MFTKEHSKNTIFQKATFQKHELVSLLPHGESMCLIDAVTAWNSDTIECCTKSHLDKNNPLLIDNLLPPTALLEYAAQVAGIHLALVHLNEDEAGPPEIAYLAALKQVDFFGLDIGKKALKLVANCLIRQGGSAIYEITIYSEKTCLVKGRINLSQ